MKPSLGTCNDTQLATFLGGANVARYTRVFARFAAGHRLSLNVAALLWPVSWALYRRQYLGAVGLLALRFMTFLPLILPWDDPLISSWVAPLAWLAGMVLTNIFFAVAVADQALYGQLQLRCVSGPDEQLPDSMINRAAGGVCGGLTLGALVALLVSLFIGNEEAEARAQLAATAGEMRQELRPRLVKYLDEHHSRCPSPADFSIFIASRNLPDRFESEGVPWNSANFTAAEGCTVIIRMRKGGGMPRLADGAVMSYTFVRKDTDKYVLSRCMGTANYRVINFSDEFTCDHVSSIVQYQNIGGR